MASREFYIRFFPSDVQCPCHPPGRYFQFGPQLSHYADPAESQLPQSPALQKRLTISIFSFFRIADPAEFRQTNSCQIAVEDMLYGREKKLWASLNKENSDF
jgi:hypothetical protein